jgi:hypothetical protein
MKKMKMSAQQSHGPGLREINRTLQLEVERAHMERLEQQRIDFEHRAHQARDNLYGIQPAATARGWVDSKRQ